MDNKKRRSATMNKRAEWTVNSVVSTLLIISFLFLAGFMGYLSFLNDNNAVLSGTINLNKMNQTFNKSVQLSDQIQNSSQSLPSGLSTFDFLALGYDSIKSILQAPALFLTIISFIQENSWFSWLPAQFWGLIFALITAAIVLIVLGAVWRYKFV